MADLRVVVMLALQLLETQAKILSSLYRMIQTMVNSNDQRVCAVRSTFDERIKRSREDFEARSRQNIRRRRRQRLVLLNRFALVSRRRMWTRERPNGPVFWSNVLNNFDEDEWRSHFRMSRNTFNFLLEFVELHLRRRTTNWRKPLEPQLRLAIALWWYATPSEYRSISCIFGVGVSTVCVLVHQVTAALKEALFKRFVCLPNAARLQETMDRFAERGYPMCAGAIDGTHIPILAPREDEKSYYNRKGWHSIVLQAVVDHKYCFTDVYVGWPGRTHDARVLANSPLYKKAEEQGGYLFPREKSIDINGVEVPVHLIGDPAYPLRKWLMKGFTSHHALDQPQRNFNYHLSSARMVVENAFGRLKGRWRCLAKRNDISTTSMPDVVVACCILHNVCEINKEHFLPEWNTEQPGLPEPEQVDFQGAQAHGPQAVRDAIVSIL